MKKLFIIILLFSLTGFSSFAQEQTEKIRKNSVSVDYGTIVGRYRHMYSYNVNLCYRRSVWRGMGIGAVYQHYKYDFCYVWHWAINTSEPEATITSNSALVRLDYQVPISNHFSLFTYGQIGMDWKDYGYNRHDHALVYARGLKIEYHYSALSVYLQHEYCLPKLKEKKIENIDLVNTQGLLEHRKISIGAGFNF